MPLLLIKENSILLIKPPEILILINQDPFSTSDNAAIEVIFVGKDHPAQCGWDVHELEKRVAFPLAAGAHPIISPVSLCVTKKRVKFPGLSG